jgi:hypothetical protein
MSRHEDWRCSKCGRLLGRQLGDRLHIRFGARGQAFDYTVSLPARALCRDCGTENSINPEARDARSTEAPSARDGASCPSTTSSR